MAEKVFELNLELLKETNYRKFYEEVKDKFYDYRRVYQNIYEMLIETLEYAIDKDINNLYIISSISKQIREDKETLDRIMKVFKK